MLWLTRYTKRDDFFAKNNRSRVGIFHAGNALEVIKKVCELNKIPTPKTDEVNLYGKNSCSFLYNKAVHTICICPAGEMIDIK